MPAFKSAEEEAKFWETHSAVDYLSELKELDGLFVLSPALSQSIKDRAKKKAISLRLSNWEIELAKKIAKNKNIPYQRLLREWIDAGIRSNYTGRGMVSG